MQYDDWLQYAERSGAFLSIARFRLLVPRLSYDVVPVDYVKFLINDYPYHKKSRDGLEVGKAYRAPDMFAKFKAGLIRKGPEHRDSGYVMREGGIVQEEFPVFDVKLRLVGERDYIETSLVNVESDWLSCGSGDGYTRYVLWDRLAIMPDIVPLPGMSAHDQ